MHLSKFKRTEPFGADRIASDNASPLTYNTPRFKTPSWSFLETSIGEFNNEIRTAHSLIREYSSPTEGYLYFAAAGSNCRGYVVLPNRLSCFQELAAEFSAQGRDPALAQLVWGHGRAIRQPGTCLQSSFFVVEEWVSLTIHEAVL
ncbi:hypothetical protein B0H14DRAFT_2571327 [Mycena olivaceomarginata]|nr:hypothetical protein B0H14DRAFT_2571327 [Mycena olivaceomarginata]